MHASREVSLPEGLAGIIGHSSGDTGIVLFAHGSGSGRFSPRNAFVAEGLQSAGLSTLLLDLLTSEEAHQRDCVFDISLLADRLILATEWVRAQKSLKRLPVGLFGASTGAGGALRAAARKPDEFSAVVCRGGRPDLAGPELLHVRTPTLLIVGERDDAVITLNRNALASLQVEKELVIVPGAGHLFEEPGTLAQVRDLAAAWFRHHLVAPGA